MAESGFESDPRIESVLLDAAAIRARIREMAQAIAGDLSGHDEITLLGVLKGAFVFMSDLGRELREAGGPSVRFEFVRAKTYGAAIKGTGETERTVSVDWLGADLAGKDVVLVEDILDQGFTLAHIRELLLTEVGVKSVRICVLLDKQLDCPTPAVRALRETLPVDYHGFRVPDRWVAGYGLDVAEEFRELPCVIVVRESCFLSD
ncbi:MAG: hypoxanthine phosphoribosyltransferase [Lentisphaerae bacterium]|jgi:hypoxanthine phosphoribosyltransferase|nr:hypoxanthine phosphoribosyltransferase [Lentisphaerota bacterium]MBT4814468.1 hypoxanthine phosphoribosyltransferase [Lentisphaerota bacterium]MBT5604512.1 hypoxanthine phosphoribosyltransferase [Lentisphaerota bacterium]MBT7057668.1 hypoxanthine phosphoribosyltransferase [Lentisphaerota bacterium]MBT7841635.1 hypoxanthine phosphoribosyltransferase [Lentisphaerota bacterium]